MADKPLIPRPVILSAALAACLMTVTSLSAQEMIRFTAEQVAGGEKIYRETCQICHGNRLSNGQFGTPLRGSYFRNNWRGKSLGDLVLHTQEKMPPDNVMSMTVQQCTEVVSFILSRNDVEPGEKPMEADIEKLMTIALPWQ